MKAFTSIFRHGRRPKGHPEGARERPSRSFASTFAALEGRALLSTAGPVLWPTTAPSTLAAPPFATTSGHPSPTSMMDDLATAADPNNGPASPARAVPLPVPPTDPDHRPWSPDGARGQGGPGSAWGLLHHDPFNDHVAMDVGKVDVDGRATPEFALADFGTSQVFVHLGMGGAPVLLGPSQGISHPFSVKLADLDDDGIPELVVANTGADNVLVFPGLPGGQFGPEVNGGLGYSAGVQPVSITVSYVDDDPRRADLIVASQGSLEAAGGVSILEGQVTAAGWSASAGPSIVAQGRPVKTVLYDANGDGIPDLFVCNSGSDSVTMYRGQVDGSFEPDASSTFEVGRNPIDFFIGRFENRSQVDLVTLNSGSDDMTFIGDFLGSRATTRAISSGGVLPDAAFAIDAGHDGVMDLVVANAGDGHLAVFRGADDGLQLAGVITRSGVDAPTALALSSSGVGGIDFFAANAGDDAAQLLHFDLGVASTYLPGGSDAGESLAGSDFDLFAQLMPLGESSLELVAVLWAGGPDDEAVSGRWGLHEASMMTALYSPTEGQGEGEAGTVAEASGGPPPPPARGDEPAEGDDSRLSRFLFGLADAFERPREVVAAIAERDLAGEGEGRSPEALARLDLDKFGDDRPPDHDAEAASGAVDEALRMFWTDGLGRENLPPADSSPRFDPTTYLDHDDAPTLEGRLEAVPLISSALAVSTRLILKASPPRPSTFRGKAERRRFVSLGNEPDARGKAGPV